MNNQKQTSHRIKYVAGILGIIIVAGLVFLMLVPGPSSDSKVNSGDVSEGGRTFTGSLVDLQNRGGNHRCTFSDEHDVETSGVVYVGENRVRGDFESTVQGITVDSHMIVKDGVIYAWTPIAPNGFIIPQNIAEQQKDSEAYSDFNQAYTYDCETWNEDEMMFEIPDIDFISLEN